MINNFFFKLILKERTVNALPFKQKLLKNNFFWRQNEFFKKTLEIPKIIIAHISKFLGVFEGQKYKIGPPPCALSFPPLIVKVTAQYIVVSNEMISDWQLVVFN